MGWLDELAGDLLEPAKDDSRDCGHPRARRSSLDKAELPSLWCPDCLRYLDADLGERA